MVIEKNNFKNGFNFFCLSLCAFAGLGLEALLAFLIEPFIYGKSLNEFSITESILHWVLTCIIWAVVSLVLIKAAKKKYTFDIFSYKSSIGLQNWILCFVLLAISLVIKFISWNGFKVVKEFLSNGWLKFIFQYIYYLFETILFILIIVFAQRAGEVWFRKDNIPWGGILVALTWGLSHIFTKGELLIGILAFFGGLLYGILYLVSKKNIYIAYPLIFLMFVL
ncbi:hypothetical protein [Fonticella tunisiensis]|uniref:CAAX prenyl protease-like protein n=1 Tax=Fonticella tunisiensis TaxID=1096341 RepID=A0A4R7K698_9CLOT|nr:hypothetical protein [Fonticella tunisiensis]TDT45633.1 hypothetical protein EDD71_1592 [Fonticella tunisiensis]